MASNRSCWNDVSVAPGASFIFNPEAGTLSQGSTTVHTHSATTLSFNHLVYEIRTMAICPTGVWFTAATRILVCRLP